MRPRACQSPAASALANRALGPTCLRRRGRQAWSSVASALRAPAAQARGERDAAPLRPPPSRFFLAARRLTPYPDHATNVSPPISSAGKREEPPRAARVQTIWDG